MGTVGTVGTPAVATGTGGIAAGQATTPAAPASTGGQAVGANGPLYYYVPGVGFVAAPTPAANAGNAGSQGAQSRSHDGHLIVAPHLVVRACKLAFWLSWQI